MFGQGTISFIQRTMPNSVRSLVPQSVRIRLAELLGKIDERDIAVVAAKTATQTHDWETAAKLWREVLERSRGFGSEAAVVKLSEALRLSGRLEDAEAALSLQVARQLSPAIAIERARIAMVRGDWPAAIGHWLSCIDGLDRNTHACTEVSQTYRMLKQFDEADALMARVLAREPQNLGVAMECARIARDMQDWGQAAERWRNVLDRFASDRPPEAVHGLYVALKSLGDDQANEVFKKYQSEGLDGAYERWLAEHDMLGDEDRAAIRQHIEKLNVRPKFSILMPVYNAPQDFLHQAIESVMGQFYQDWELCVVDDASPDKAVQAILEDYGRKDARIRPMYRDENGGIAVATNTALAAASGDWVVLMDHDDVLPSHALYMIAERLNRCPHATIVYSDEDHIDPFGQRSHPYFKPDFNYDLLLGQNLFNHLTAYRADLAQSVGGFREGFDGSQDWDFALRVLDAAPDGTVEHIPFVLYHWRQTGQNFSAKSLARAVSTAERAVNEHFARRGVGALAAPTEHSSHLRVKWPLPSPHPLVSVVIPTKDRTNLLSVCVDGLLHRTDYAPLEIVIVDNGSTEPEAIRLHAELAELPNVTVVEVPEPFNFSRLVNLGVARSNGDVVLLLNNDIDVIKQDWLGELVGHALRPDVGAVGAKLYYEDDILQHGGVILGVGGVAGHAFKYFPRDSNGYANRLQLTQQMSCVTGACLATRRTVFDELRGFDEVNLPVAFNDVDFCLRVGAAGYKVIWTPVAELYHYESISRGSDQAPEKIDRFRKEKGYIMESWGDVLINDPFYNPNLTHRSEGFEIARSPRVEKPWCAG